jgi:hypothetical protein
VGGLASGEGVINTRIADALSNFLLDCRIAHVCDEPNQYLF